MKSLRGSRSVRLLLALSLVPLVTVTAAYGGLVVDSVVPGSPAAAAEIRPGDRIVRLADRKIASLEDLEQALTAYRPGDTVMLACTTTE